MSKSHCAFGYQYRDASNYKAFGELLLVGSFTNAARVAIETKLDSEGLFVPEFVGLSALQTSLEGFPSKDDHIWHEYLYFRPATDGEIAGLTPWGDLSQLVFNFAQLEAWGSLKMLQRIGLLLEEEPYSLMK